MGTQIHNTGDNYRRVVELVQAGVLGKVETRARVEGRRLAHRSWPTRQARDAPGLRRLRSVGRAGADAAVRRIAFPFQLALLVGFRRRHAGRFRLPLHGPAVLGPESALSNERAGQGRDHLPRPTTTCRTTCRSTTNFPARGDRRRCISPGITASWRPEGAEAYGKGSAVLFEGERGRLLADYGTRKLFLEPGLHRRDAAARRFPARSGITRNGFAPARRARPRPAISTTPARWPKPSCWATFRTAPAARNSIGMASC